MKTKRIQTAATLAGAIPLVAGSALAANHREAPITALDHKADITDVFAFRSYGPTANTNNVTMILCVDPLLEPGNGPNWFPFDDDIMYEIKVDNNNDAQADVTFQFRFTTEQRLPNVFTTYAGIAGGANAPANSPPNAAGMPTVGTPVVPDRINDFNDAGLGQRQTYTVTMVKTGGNTSIVGSGALYAVPANVGPRTMDYPALFAAGTYTGLTGGISTFTGTVNDPFWIDLGGAFDTLNLRPATGPLPGVMSAANDAAAANVADRAGVAGPGASVGRGIGSGPQPNGGDGPAGMLTGAMAVGAAAALAGVPPSNRSSALTGLAAGAVPIRRAAPDRWHGVRPAKH